MVCDKDVNKLNNVDQCKYILQIKGYFNNQNFNQNDGFFLHCKSQCFYMNFHIVSYCVLIKS